MDPRQPHVIYEFGEFQLDALRRVLSSRTNGEPLQVTPRVFDALLYFVEHAGQLLDKRTLLTTLWPNVIVEESSLPQTIHALRQVLGEHPDEHRFIVTVPGRGYRFVADVAVRAVDDPAPAAAEPAAHVPVARRSYRKLLTLAPVAFAVIAGLVFWLLRAPEEVPRKSASSPLPSIAVLPFVDMSPEANQQYFADGLSEEILNLLAQSAALRVIARTSSFSFRDRSADIATIAAKLHVTHVLEGSVRKSGERIRVTAQLVDAATSVHTWSETYDRDLQDVFTVQKDIAASVAASLQVTLVGSDRPQSGETNSALAYEHYLQGRYFFHRRGGAADLARARTYFEQALEIDPTYARAWAGLAGAYWVGADVGEPVTPATLPEWHAAIEQALRFGPNLAEAHARAAQYYWMKGDLQRADEHFERATALGPSDLLVLGMSAGRALRDGRLNEALALQRRVVALDPLSATYRSNLASDLIALGQWEEAKAELQKALELSPTSLHNYASLCTILIVQQRFDAALSAIEHVPQGPMRERCQAMVYQAMGDAGASDAALARLTALAKTSQRDLTVMLSIAEVYAFRGDSDATFAWLTRADRQAKHSRDATALWYVQSELQLSPFFKHMAADPRWRLLMASAIEQ
jgi:TolB-like protein/DNA-binding winged helix-turn-helix (wHTH) protein/Flp pilus assembly protein TadD